MTGVQTCALPICSLFQIPKPTKIQVKIGQLILSPLLEEICKEGSAWRVGRLESAERPAFVSFCFILAMRSPPPVISFSCRFIPNPCQRIWEQMRSSPLPDSFVAAPRFGRLSSQIRLRLLPCSLTGIGEEKASRRASVFFRGKCSSNNE